MLFCTILGKRGEKGSESALRLNKTLLLFTVTKIPDYLEKEQVDELLQAAKTCSERDYLLLRFMWRTGVRVSEVINVTPNDIEFKNGVVNIRKAKGGKQRRVPLDEDTLKMLSDYILALNTPEDRPVFSIKRTQVFNLVKKYGKMAGVKIHPHTLRHSFAINLVRGGTDLRRVQLMLGHSSLSITQVYLQFNDNDLREAYEKVAF
ncbi:MAG: tyrosine-type recombinase/integrase [Halobacteriota archaeon]